MVRKSGEKVEGTGDVSRRPQTTGVHESSRRQVLRFSASLIHRCHSLVGSEIARSDFDCRLADIVMVRHGQAGNPGRSADTSEKCAAAQALRC